jgi:hypothetical protein
MLMGAYDESVPNEPAARLTMNPLVLNVMNLKVNPCYERDQIVIIPRVKRKSLDFGAGR